MKRTFFEQKLSEAKKQVLINIPSNKMKITLALSFSGLGVSSLRSALPKMLLPLKLTGAVLPGDSTTSLVDFTIAPLQTGEVLVQTKASTICGSDIRCIYREHLGKGAEGYQAGGSSQKVPS